MDATTLPCLCAWSQWSGEVDAEEIQTLLETVTSARFSQGQVAHLLLSVGKQPHEVLRRSDFIKLMSQNDILGREGGDQRSQDLLIMQYRRQRMIDDIKDPDRRKGFASEEAFNDLLVKTKEALGRDWLPHAAEVVAAAAAYQLYQLPQPAACRQPTGTTGASILKFSRGDTPSLSVG